MKLYDAMTPNSLRVTVFLAEKGIDVPRQSVDVMGGGTRTPDFLALNSRGELPTLILDDGTILTETVAICRYFEALNPEPSLMGRTALDQARIEMWNRRIEFHLFGPAGEIGRHTIPFFADRVEQIPAYAESQRRRFANEWEWLDAELSDGRGFIAGDQFSIADITGMAMLFVAMICEIDLPGAQTHAARWAGAMRARPSFAAQFAQAA